MMRINISRLLQEPWGSLRKYDLDEGSLRLGDDLEVDFLRGTLRLTHTNEGILVQGKLTTQVTLECVRCLEPFAYRLSVNLTERFLPAPAAARDGEALSISNDNSVDLDEPIREAILLALPMRSLCRPDCRGLCPECGQNLNLGQCGCQKEDIDPRLDVLRQLL
ncbi:MAG: DUF177 domain-containing protein [Anaerolineae bacterium]|jgi:uncharacterized protein|nr:DUF177 domain-containing protein [Anaerolineae bacterium]MDH7474302.1 DUF177 domain-containing protein [Anaerolineae bacterium]